MQNLNAKAQGCKDAKERQGKEFNTKTPRHRDTTIGLFYVKMRANGLHFGNSFGGKLLTKIGSRIVKAVGRQLEKGL